MPNMAAELKLLSTSIVFLLRKTVGSEMRGGTRKQSTDRGRVNKLYNTFFSYPFCEHIFLSAFYLPRDTETPDR
jgi:hypothetical protein